MAPLRTFDSALTVVSRTPLPSLRVGSFAGLAVLTLVMGTIGCSKADEKPVASASTTASIAVPLATIPGEEGGTGTTAGPASASLAAGQCPPATAITYFPDSGAGEKTEGQKLDVKVTFGDVTLDSSVVIAFANYDLKEADASKPGVPNVTGDQVLGSFYLSATQGKKLVAGDYIDVAEKTGEFQFNTHSLFTGKGRVIASGFDVPDSVATITKIDKEFVCGTVITGEFEGVFKAPVV